MHHSRQLAAIMFTDIVGYTALMGNDEHKAFELLSKNRQIQLPIIEEFNGQFIKELGDGILACFPTASDSLHAAMKIQKACSASKDLSLRIGIHEGETTFENDDIFGDAVNIASRIQTLGTPGSILFSKKIADEVKNKTEFHMVSLGSFEFRNVSESIEVFALANDGLPVPKRSMMDGKLKKKYNQKLKLFAALLLIVIAVAAFFVYNGFLKKDSFESLKYSDGRISVAVMPFQNMTNDSIWDIWQEGIQTSLMNFLSNSKEIIVIEAIKDMIQSKGLVDYNSLTTSIASDISKKLDAKVFITGNIMKAGSKIRVNAQIFDTDNKESLKSFEIEGYAKTEMIFQVVDSLRKMVKNFLAVTKLVMDDPKTAEYFDPISSPEAYKYMVSARKAGTSYSAIEMYKNALRVDSNIYDAISYIAQLYFELGDYEKGRSWLLKYHSKYDKLDMYNKIFADYLYSIYLRTPYEAIKYIKQLIDITDKAPYNYSNLGDEYWELLQYDKAIPEYERSLEIFLRLGSKPLASIYPLLGNSYHKTGQYKKEGRLYKKAEKDFPNSPLLIQRQAILALTERDTIGANKYIENYRSIRKENLWSEATILRGVAGVYNEAGILNVAEKYYRQAFSLEPENPLIKNSLAYFLIDKDQNVNEGLELIEKGIKSQPESFNYLHTKGWGLYKLGKLAEAMEILQKSWDLRMKNATYNHEAYLHLDKAKKAVAIQKNN